MWKIKLKKLRIYLNELKKDSIFAPAIREYLMRHFGELAEWSNAAVLKTVEGHTSRGSNPLLSAKSPTKGNKNPVNS